MEKLEIRNDIIECVVSLYEDTIIDQYTHHLGFIDFDKLTKEIMSGELTENVYFSRDDRDKIKG